MPSFIKNDYTRTPFGKNVYYRSTRDLKFESYTLYAPSVPTLTIDGNAEKILQPGTVIAKITSGGGSGKVGPFQAGATDGRQTTTNILGVLETFLPWETNERDAEVAVCYEGAVVQAWCFEWTAVPAQVVLGNTTRDAILALPNVALLFK